VFVWVHLFDPHLPYEPPPPFDVAHAGDPYRGEIAFTDEQTGRLLDGWQAAGRLDSSIVVLTADHGEGLGEHGELTHAYFLYDSTVRVPLAIHVCSDCGIEVIEGHQVDEPVSLLDLAPTLADLAGLPPATFDGVSLRGALAGAAPPPRALALECLEPAYVYSSAPPFGVLDTGGQVWIDLPSRERYDIASDPHQQTNLYQAADAPQADELFTRFDRAWPPTDSLEPLDAESLARLEALGYVLGGTTHAVADSGLDPKDLLPVAQLVMGQGLDRTPVEALARAQALVVEFGPLPALAFYEADRLSELGRRREAICALEASEAAHPHEPRLSRELATRRASLQQDERLAETIRRTLDTQPDHATARYDLALVSHRLERWDEAIRLYEEVLGRDPHDDEARLMYARAVGAHRGPEEALSVLQQGRSRAGHSPALDCAAGRLLAWYLDRPDEARTALTTCRDAGQRLEPRDREVLGEGP